MKRLKFLLLLIVILLSSCVKIDYDFSESYQHKKTLQFILLMSKDGYNLTKTSYNTNDKEVDMNMNESFGIMAITSDSSLVINNEKVLSTHSYAEFDITKWNGPILFNAYYPYTDNVYYYRDSGQYLIPYLHDDVSSGPLVSKTKEWVMSYDRIPLEFYHITNNIGVKIKDITQNENLKNLIIVKKIIFYNIAKEGLYYQNFSNKIGSWKSQSHYENIVLYEGNNRINSDIELYVGKTDLTTNYNDANRFYSVPTEIKLGKQYIEVIFDVDEFYLDGVKYPKLIDQKQTFQIYGVLPENKFINGKEYTFHIGIDLGEIYKTIEFSANIIDWFDAYNLKIYENNNDF